MEQVGPLGHLGKTNALKQNHPRGKQDEMHRPRRVLGPHGLGFVAQEPNTRLGKHVGGFLGHRCPTLDEDPSGGFLADRSSAAQKLLGLRGGDIPFARRHQARADEMLQRKGIHGLAVV